MFSGLSLVGLKMRSLGGPSQIPISFAEVRRRGVDPHLQRVVWAMMGDRVVVDREDADRETLAVLGYGVPCPCGERGLRPDEGDVCGLCGSEEAVRPAEGDAIAQMRQRARDDLRAVLNGREALVRVYGRPAYELHLALARRALAFFGAAACEVGDD